MRTLAALALAGIVAVLGGCLSAGTYFSVAMDVATNIANTAIADMADAELLEHRELVADVHDVTGQVDAKLAAHLVAIDLELAERGVTVPP